MRVGTLHTDTVYRAVTIHPHSLCAALVNLLKPPEIPAKSSENEKSTLNTAKLDKKIAALNLYLSGTDVQQIAADNGVSLATVYRWLDAARAHLQQLHEQEIDDRNTLARARYTATIAAFWKAMQAGDHKAARIVMDATQRIVELDGLAAPIRMESTVETKPPQPLEPQPEMTDAQFLALAASVGIHFETK